METSNIILRGKFNIDQMLIVLVQMLLSILTVLKKKLYCFNCFIVPHLLRQIDKNVTINRK